MKTKTFDLFFAGVLCCFLTAGAAGAATPPAGEEALFTTSTAPDALILLDLSGSMDWNPAGGNDIWGNSSCSDTTFHSSSEVGHETRCSRIAIAKRAIFDILDDNDDNTINGTDETSLGVRIGYMRYYDCDSNDTGGDYASGLQQADPGDQLEVQPDLLRELFELLHHQRGQLLQLRERRIGQRRDSPRLGAQRGKALSRCHKAADSVACRQKFVILITDGADTYACGGSGTEVQTDMYKRRRETVAKAKALADAGYKVFVIGFGAGMPAYLQNTLNWMAYYGGTDNPNIDKRRQHDRL